MVGTMNYKIYKMIFTQGIHFGEHSLEKSEITFQADTLFSALCIEALKIDKLDELLESVKENNLVFSDAFPYMGQEFFIPKPMKKIEQVIQSEDMTTRKKFKKLEYIQVSLLNQYLKGQYPIDKGSDIKKLGVHALKTSASIRGNEEALPYRVGIYRFKKENGLYIVVGYDSQEILDLFDELFEMLSLSGIGGKKNSGLGHFDLEIAELPKELNQRLNTKGEVMTLSVSLPTEDELDDVLDDSRYLLVKRSGFIDSYTYSKEQRRKKDIYLFKSGSCFNKTYQGDVYDVSSGGNHSVYKYAKPLFMGVEV